jgi:RNA polymerase sigma factor (TIGR02999 family)
LRERLSAAERDAGWRADMSKGDVTDLLIAYRDGDREAFERLIPLVYDDLRRIARRQLGRGRPGRTLDTTALVHEAYIDLARSSRLEINDRRHFFAVAARAMRQVIIDYARERAAAKRGGGRTPVPLDLVQIPVDAQAEVVLAIDGALRRLSELNERLTRVFECRYFAGLSEQETAEALDLSLRTVQRDWMKGKAWLRRELAAG